MNTRLSLNVIYKHERTWEYKYIIIHLFFIKILFSTLFGNIIIIENTFSYLAGNIPSIYIFAMIGVCYAIKIL